MKVPAAITFNPEAKSKCGIQLPKAARSHTPMKGTTTPAEFARVFAIELMVGVSFPPTSYINA
jgi:hypothetical protein